MQPITSKAMLTTISILYFSILSTMIFFTMVIIYLANTGSLSPEAIENPDLFRYVIYALTPIMIAIGLFIFKQQMGRVLPETSLRNKVGQYQVAMLVRAACFEIPGLFGAVCAFITGDLLFLVFTGLIALLFIYFRPTPESISGDLQLSETERAILLSPDGAIE